MFQLFADTTTSIPEEFFPVSFWMGLVGSLIYAAVGGLMILFLYKLTDAILPGKSSDELVPINGRTPNVALAIVKAAMILGFCLIIAAAIH